MKKSLKFKALAVAGLAVLAASTIQAQQTNALSQIKFVPGEVRVIDSVTLLPIAAATLQPVCLGGTPYATNTYFTNPRGFARVMTSEKFAAIKATAPGYSDSTRAFFSTNGVLTNAIVPLKRAKE
jgi:hypothetical protein